jgi:hypothetical protein
LVAVFFMASSLEPKPQVSMLKVREGSNGMSCMLKIVKKDFCTENDQDRFPMNIQEKTSLVRNTTENILSSSCDLEEEKKELGE